MKLRSLLLAVLGVCAGATAHATLLTQCPAVGADPGCAILITVTSVNGSGVATGFFSTDGTNAANNPIGPYDGVEDTLFGILNSSGGVLKSISLASNPATDLFGFDGDGACTFISCPATAVDPNHYGGPGVLFSNIASGGVSGTVNLGCTTASLASCAGIANGTSAWFSLEEVTRANQIVSGTPEPGAWLLLSSGLIAFGLARRRLNF